MKHKKVAAFISIAAIAVLTAFTKIDDDPISRIAAQLYKWLSVNPPEKVYLQLDKSGYAVGDDIWFKAYVTAGSGHELSAISGVLNVELIDDRDSVVRGIKLPVIGGLTWGDFALPDTLKEGNYRVRAYTRWMRNAGEAYFFEKNITVINAVTNSVFTKTVYTYPTGTAKDYLNALITYTDADGKPYAGKPVSYEVRINNKTAFRAKGQTDDRGNITISFNKPLPATSAAGRIITYLKLSDQQTVTKSILIKAAFSKVDVQFFPEGGSLVNGNECKVAFKAVDDGGLGANIKGIVTDGQNIKVTEFSSTHLGMGIFSFTPQSGKSYAALITYADGSQHTVPLPAAVNSGYSLSVDNTDAENIRVKILPGPAVINGAQNDAVSLVAHAGGVLCYAGKSKPGSKYFTAEIPKSRFPTGIVQFTLFSSAGEPLNERLVFVRNDDQLKLDVTAEKQVYAPREKVNISLDARDKAGTPETGSFSVSVINETLSPADEATAGTIMSSLLLTSDLRGYIEKPGYYFENLSEKTRADLDVLMLTQGYHRFKWKQVMDNTSPPVVYAPEKSLEISGHLKNLLGRPVAHGRITLLSTTGGTFITDTTTDEKGRFVFKNLVFRDSVKFVIQGRTAKDRRNTEIDVDHIAPPPAGPDKNAPDGQVNIGDVLSPYLQNSRQLYAVELKNGLGNHGIYQLKEVEIKAKKKPVENSENLNGAGNADQIIQDDLFSSLPCAVISDCLQGRLTGVIFRNGIPYSTRSINIPMAIVLDGAFVDPDVFTTLNAADIGSIEVLRSIEYTAIYGGRGSGGLLVITTKRGGGSVYQRYAPGIITYHPRGYYKSRVFYSPRYDDPKTNAALPDLRSTVYWKPNLVTGRDGKTSFDYFNADTKGTYRVVIEGIGRDGSLGRQVYRYKVE